MEMTFINKNITEYKFSDYEDPYQESAPWPTMRGDMKNSGRLRDLKWKGKSTTANEIIHFNTGNAIFSTPIIDANERIYVGSADHFFYAFDPNQGKELWRFDAGEIIDSAGCIDKEGTVYIGTGSAKIHAFSPEGKEKWTYDLLSNRLKEQFTFSSNFWYEANIVLGPDGAIYVANDDFFLYKMTRDGKMIWGYRTGFLIWSAASFWKDGTVFIAGFDHILYALNMETGKLKWKTDLHGSQVGSPAISENGILYQTAFNGNIYALNCQNGAKIWEFKTGSHVYASVAISLDDTIYVGSTNGTFYALEGKTGKIKWTYYIGDPIRSSASIGPDPEDKEPYLIYFGGGDGKVYALEPNGNLRWSYDTLLRASNTDYPNINASVALGNFGLCVACSTGDVVYLPYDSYMKEDAEGFERGSGKQADETGAFWHYVTAGGSLHIEPIKDGIQDIDPTNITTLRLISHDKSGLLPCRLKPKSIKITTQPKFKHRIEIQSDSITMNIISNRILNTDTNYTLKITGKYINKFNQTKSIESTLLFKTRNPPKMASILSSENQTFKIVHMAVPQPAIVPSLDQIGLASLTIPFSVIESDHEEKTFSAFAVQKFGEVGVPQKRISLYAFSGKVEGDYFQMDCRNCEFEITSFTIPLDRFRISGFLRTDGTVARGGNLLIEKDWHGSLFNLMRDLVKNSPISVKMLKGHLKSGGIRQFVKAALSFFPALFRQLFRGTWQSWGLLNHNNKLTGVGTFRLEPIPNEKESIKDKVQVKKFELDPIKKQILAEVEIPNKADEWETAISILLVEKTKGLAIPINYTTDLKYEDIGEGKKRILLSIPKSVYIEKRNIKAFLMADIYPLQEIEL
jgi:outer membrane protein assembly factor BamB